jgi:ABC-type iron transport system FetAB ATPase subunit
MNVRLDARHETLERRVLQFQDLVPVPVTGGERQRVALARTLLRDAPILLLDQPTSSVDVKTEILLMDGLERLVAGRRVWSRPGSARWLRVTYTSLLTAQSPRYAPRSQSAPRDYG